MRVILVLIVAMTLPRSVLGQVQFDRFFPPTVGLGTSTTVKAEGKFPTWPLNVYCDRKDLVVTPGPNPGEFEISVPSEVPHGVAWIRLFDDQSASGLIPLLIEPNAIFVEKEPNNRIKDASAIGMPVAVVGRLEKNGDVDSCRVSLKKGQTLAASVVAHRVLRSPMDMVMQIVDLQGNVLSQSDDEIGLDPQLIYKCDEDCELVLRLFAFPETPNSTIGFAGGAGFVYLLRLTTNEVLDHTLPLQVGPNPSEVKAFGWGAASDFAARLMNATEVSPKIALKDGVPGWQWVSQIEGADSLLERYESEGNQSEAVSVLPAIFSGHIRASGEVDCYSVSVQTGVKYRVTAIGQRFGFPIDTVLKVVDSETGAAVGQNDDMARNEYDARVEFTAQTDGVYELQVSDLAESASARHAYSILMETAQPRFRSRCATEHFSMKQEGELEIEVSIERQHGFAGRLKVEATGLPMHVLADPVISEPKDASAKSVKLVLTAGSATTTVHSPFQILATEIDADGNVIGPPACCLYELRPAVLLNRYWLTVTATK